MKIRLTITFVALFLFANFGSSYSFQQDVTIVAPTSEAAEGLDLQAVSELFKDSENVEAFEKALNDPDTGVNNLDLDDNGEVDFIRVVEKAADETHVMILQVPLSETEFQDVATIEIEKSGDEAYNMQIHGNEVIYGADYYVAPTHVHIHTWPIIGWMYRPAYRPYRSRYYFGFYPRWHRPYRPVTVNVYRTRTVRYRSTTTFRVSNTTRVRTVNKVNYQPRSSTLVKKKTRVVANPKTGKVKKTTVRTRNTPAGKKKTTVTKGSKKTVKKGGKKATVKKGSKKTKPKKGVKRTKVKKKK